MANTQTEIRSSNVILKMKFSMPNPPVYLKGKDRVDYMEERAWVANDFIDYAARRGKYAEKAESHDARFAILPEKGNYLDYVSRQGTFAEKGEKGGGSDGTGAWGKNGPLEGDELERVKQIFKTTGGNIWHGIISPTKELGDRELDTKEKAIEFTKACFTRFISSTHLDYNNVEWYCGWHDDSESGIKHIQFAFCEKEPHLTGKGERTYTRKGVIRTPVLADALISFEEYFSGHRNDLHVARDEIMQSFKRLTPGGVRKELATELLCLARVLPKVQGRAGYRHKDYAPYRERVDRLADKMIRDIPELNRLYIELAAKISEREERFAKTAEQFSNMRPTDKIAELRADVRQRLGNAIISFAKRIDYSERQKDYAALRQERLTLVALAREEAALRRKQKNERRADLKRFNRLYNSFYSKVTSKDYLAEYYADIERLRYGFGNDRDAVEQKTE